ncbi:hypothetical protein ACFL35_19445 [Candidatus Riflebacteria bacterium]
MNPPLFALPKFLLRYKFQKDHSLVYTLKIKVTHNLNHYGVKKTSRHDIDFLVSMKTLKVEKKGNAVVLFRILSGGWKVNGKLRKANFQSRFSFLVNPFGQVIKSSFKGFKKELFLFQTPPFPLTLRSNWKVKKKLLIPELNLPLIFMARMNIKSYEKTDNGNESVVILSRFFGRSSKRFPYKSSLKGKSNILFDITYGFIRQSALALEIKSKVSDRIGTILSHHYKVSIKIGLNQ